MIKSTEKLVRNLFLMIFMIVFSLSTVGFQVNAQESETMEKLLGEKVLDDLSEGTMTRVEFVKMINSVFGFNEMSTVTFDDCEEGTWYDEEVRKAVAAGYIYGYGDGRFRPDQSITTEEAVTLIYRVFEPTTSKEVQRVETTSSWSQEAFSMLLHRDFIDRSSVRESKGALGKAEAFKMLEKAAGNVLTVAKTKKSVIKGNVVINKPIKSLRNVTIENDLYITAEALSKDLKLDNVKVKGKVHIIGGDASTKSFIMENSETSELKVDKKVSVALAKKSKVEEVQLNKETVLLTSKDTSIEKVIANNKKAEIRAEGKIKNLVLKENATVNGKDVKKGEMAKVDSGTYKEKDSSYKKLIKTESKAVASSGSSSSSSSSGGTSTPVKPDPTPVTPEPDKPVTPVKPDPKPVDPVTPEPKPVEPVNPVTPDPDPTPVKPDPVAPVAPTPVTDAEIGITLVGPNPMTILKDTPYVEPGYTATYTEGNRTVGLKTTDVTSSVVIEPQPVKTTTVGTLTITYSVEYKGKSNKVTRNLEIVKDLATPDPGTEPLKDLSIRLKGNPYMSLCVEDGFVDPGVVAIYDGKDVSSEVVISGITPEMPGYYDMIYTITKGSQVKTVKRIVTISKRNYTYEDKVRIRDRAYLSVLGRKSSLDLGEPILWDNAKEIVEFFRTRPVIYDFLSGGITYYGTYENGVLYATEFVPKYRKSFLDLSDEEYKKYYEALVNGPRAIVQSKINASMTDYEKIKILHDYIVNITTYDMENLKAGTIPYESYSAIGVLVKGVAVCEGYMEAYQLLLNEAGIENRLVIGTATNRSGATGGHGWNLVKLDGKWYHVDTTWDDPYVVGANRLRYDYFLKSDTFMKKNHTWTQGDLPYATEDYTIK